MIFAQQEQTVKLTEASRELEVAKLERDAANFQAEAMLLKAGADRDVIKLKNEAEADVFTEQVQAFGSGINLARQSFYRQIAPHIQTVLTSDQEKTLGSLFSSYLPANKEIHQ